MLAVLEVIPAFCLWASEVTARVLAVLLSGIWAPVEQVPHLLGKQVRKCLLHLLVMSSRQQVKLGTARVIEMPVFYKGCIEDCW